MPTYMRLIAACIDNYYVLDLLQDNLAYHQYQHLSKSDYDNNVDSRNFLQDYETLLTSSVRISINSMMIVPFIVVSSVIIVVAAFATNNIINYSTLRNHFNNLFVEHVNRYYSEAFMVRSNNNPSADAVIVAKSMLLASNRSILRSIARWESPHDNAEFASIFDTSDIQVFTSTLTGYMGRVMNANISDSCQRYATAIAKEISLIYANKWAEAAEQHSAYTIPSALALANDISNAIAHKHQTKMWLYFKGLPII